MRFKSLIWLCVFLITPAISDDVKKNLFYKSSDFISEYVSNMIPGDGLTEVSIQLRENYKPDFSILGVRELKKLEDGNFFTQFSLISTEANNDERYVGNLGFGTRRLNDDKTLMSGLNVFVDIDSEENLRSSIGGELRNSVLDLSANFYKKLGNGAVDEKVLDGYDIQLTSQIPYLHWANAYYTDYKWFGVDRQDIEGTKYGSELFLSPYLNVDLAYDDKKIEGLNDEWYAKFNLIYPPREGPTAQDGISNKAWNSEKDMSGELVTKVKRQNKIFVEFDGLTTISRLD